MGRTLHLQQLLGDWVSQQANISLFTWHHGLLSCLDSISIALLRSVYLSMGQFGKPLGKVYYTSILKATNCGTHRPRRGWREFRTHKNNHSRVKLRWLF